MKSLLQVSVATTLAADEAVAALLLEVCGEAPASYTDNKTGRTRVSVYLRNPSGWSDKQRGALRTGLAMLRASGEKVGRVSVKTVRHEDWAESWKRHFKPIDIMGALLVKPSWSRRRPRRGQAVLTLDPGLSFGTGQHPTTRFCLEQLVACRRPTTRQAFLDIGSGSGILAIAAASLGFSHVAAFDNDPAAVRGARSNARVNGLEGKIRFSCQDLCRLPVKGTRFDVVCANLTADLLLAERTRIRARLAPGGTLVLAGILHSQFPAVRQAYCAAGFWLIRRRRVGEWESGSFRCGATTLATLA